MTVRKPPPLPNAQAPLVDANGRPTREFYSFLVALIAWALEADTELT